jgi:hypothetical protein
MQNDNGYVDKTMAKKPISINFSILKRFPSPEISLSARKRSVN